MSNLRHYELIRQGVPEWNRWRKESPNIVPDLADADLSDTDLIYANLHGAILENAELSYAHLDCANLSNADLRNAALVDASLKEADLSHTELNMAVFTGASLQRADLTNAVLELADLRYADLTGSVLKGSDWSHALIGWTVFGNNDLRSARNLHQVVHSGPSTIGIDTIYRSRGLVAEAFLLGAGVPQPLVASINQLLEKGSRYHSCFISYSTADKEFVEKLVEDLRGSGVPCWFAPKDLPIGGRIRVEVDRSIRGRDRLLLVLSSASLENQWVEQEVETALSLERNEGRTILFPIRLDNSIMDRTEGWASLIRNTRNIGDFTQWQSSGAYRTALSRLLRDLLVEGDIVY